MKMTPTETRLSNGIPVIFMPYEGAVAATYWWVCSGSASERAPESGFAHFLEHMHFKDGDAISTQKGKKKANQASTGKLAQAIESIGGDINAYTSYEQTVYHVTCAETHWEKTLEEFSQLGSPQHFSKKDFNSEREVILEELKKTNDSPDQQLFEALNVVAFGNHPYGKPIIGKPATLKAATAKDLEAFYKRRYCTDQMGLVLTGPLDEDRQKKLIKILEKGFKHFKKAPASALTLSAAEQRLQKNLTEKTNATITIKHFDVQSPTISLAFRAPSINHDDVAGLDLVASILGMGELGRLYQQLFYKKSLVSNASASLFIPKDAGLLYLQAETEKTENTVEVFCELLKEANRLKTDGPTEEELARVLINAESERYYSLQTADGVAGRIGFMRFVLGDLDFDNRYLQQIRAVTPEKVKELARKYITADMLCGAIMLPKKAATLDVKKLSKMARELLIDPVAQTPKAPSLAQLKKESLLSNETLRFTTPKGLKVVFQPNPRSYVISAHFSCLGGLRLEPQWGASHLMGLTWSKATLQKTSQEIAALTEGRAAGIDGFHGRNSVGLQLTGLARDFKPLSELLTEVLMSPSFCADELTHSKRVAEDSIRSIDDHNGQICKKLFLQNLFSKHPYGKLTSGSLESIAAITPNDLLDLHTQWVRPDRLTLSIAGNISRDDVHSYAEFIDKRFPVRDVLNELRPDEEKPLTAPRWADRQLGREQAHVIIGGLGLRLNSAERMAYQLLNTLLSGQSGRLFVELREKKSLAYSVAPIAFEGLERGYVGTYIACSPNKVNEACAGIKTVLENLAKKGPTSSELKRAQELHLGRKAMELQSDTAIAAHQGLETLYAIAPQSAQAFEREVRAVTTQEIMKVCRALFIDAHQVQCVVA